MMEKELKTKDQRHSKFKNSFGIHDYWKYYCANSKQIPFKQYKEILYYILEQYALQISDHAMDFTFPYKLGTLKVRKHSMIIKFDGDDLVIKQPVDYKATKELWKVDEEARKNKQVVFCLNQHSDGFIYSIKYTVSRLAKSTNKLRFIKFQTARVLTRRFAKNIKEHKIDAIHEVC